MVGRWRRDGTSLVRHPERPASDDLEPAGTGRSAEPDNAFRFAAEDATGRRCPFGAHVRRANPRDTFSADPETALTIANRHRILRVGRSYSPQNKAENSGLLFMCLNADIERQFEFIQQTWVLGPNFQGLEWELDPIVGGKQGNALFTIPTPEGPLRLKGIKDFVTVRGGGYFFLPGRSAVRFLSHPIP
jgi:deferrochelatase/peroxidase EfeB